MILVNIILYLLMKRKQKNTLYYTLNIVYYFILFLFMFIAYNHMTSIELGQINTTSATLMKEIMLFVPMPSYIIIVATLFKGSGFNIKTLKFDQDIDLQVTDEDNEEIEIGGNADNISFKSNFVHMIRELKYYVLENKFIFICLLILLLLVISSNIYINIEIYNKKYTINNKVALNNIILTVEDSYITNTDQGGNILAKDKYYLALKVRIENISRENITLDKKDLLIKGGDNNNLYPSYDRSSKFLDIGNRYLGNPLTPRRVDPTNKPTIECPVGYRLKNTSCIRGEDVQEGTVKNNYSCPEGYTLKEENDSSYCEEDENRKIYSLIYELNKNDIKKSYELKILNSMTNKIGDLSPSFILIKFKPKNVLNKETLGEYRYGQEIDLSDTTLGKTKLTINKVNFYNNYEYKYEFCKTKNNCETVNDVINNKNGRIIVEFEDSIIYDENSQYYINSKRLFYEDYATLKYKIGDKEMSSKLKDITPINIKNKKIYETSSLVTEGTNFYIQLLIRNKIIIVRS